MFFLGNQLDQQHKQAV